MERNPGIVNSDLYADTICDTPLKEGHISILRTDGPGLNPNEPIAIVQADVQVESPLEVTSIPDGRYLIKNRAVDPDLYWCAFRGWCATEAPSRRSIFIAKEWRLRKRASLARWTSILELFYCSEGNSLSKWDITQDANGNVTITLPPSSWVGTELFGSAVPVPWRLIPADGNSY